ncbi:MAG: alpha/beta fold hydrolase [Candidatus Cyclobacteriaceae bacterium M3_2C_046]
MKLNYREMGEGNPLIILHGLFGSSDNWLTIARKLSTGFKVYLPDQRNHGDSPHSQEFTYEVMAGDLEEFIQHHQIEKPVIVGHSMGGKVAMNFGVSHPDLFDRMVVVDIAPKAYPVHHGDILDALNAVDLGRVKSRKDADQQLSLHIRHPAIRQFLLKNLKRTDQDVFSWKLNLDVITQNIELIGQGLEQRRYTDKPILFIRGEHSQYVQDQDSIMITSLFPNSRIITIKGAGHWVHAEQPDAFLDALVHFIK